MPYLQDPLSWLIRTVCFEMLPDCYGVLHLNYDILQPPGHISEGP